VSADRRRGLMSLLIDDVEVVVFPKDSQRCSAIGLSIKENVPKEHPGRFLFTLRICARRQCEMAANSGECIKDWNFWSSLLKWTCRFELSESTVVASMAVFSIGLALSFL